MTKKSKSGRKKNLRSTEAPPTAAAKPAAEPVVVSDSSVELARTNNRPNESVSPRIGEGAAVAADMIGGVDRFSLCDSPMVSHDVAYPSQRSAEEDIDFYVRAEPDMITPEGVIDIKTFDDQNSSIRFSAVYENAAEPSLHSRSSEQLPSAATTTRDINSAFDTMRDISSYMSTPSVIAPGSQSAQVTPSTMMMEESFTSTPMRTTLSSTWRDVHPDASVGFDVVDEASKTSQPLKATIANRIVDEACNVSPMIRGQTATAEAAPMMNVETGVSFSEVLQAMMYRLFQHWEYWTSTSPEGKNFRTEDSTGNYKMQLHARIVDSLAVIVLCLVLLPAEAVSVLQRSTLGRILRLIARVAILIGRWFVESVRLLVWLSLSPLRFASTTLSFLFKIVPFPAISRRSQTMRTDTTPL